MKERKRQLLDAAVEAFGEKGYHRTQVSDIIDQAGVARGTFYLYFKSKREIFDVLMTELFQRVRNEVKTLPRDAIQAIPSQLKGNLDRVTNLLLKNPLLAKILFNESVGLDPDLDRRLKGFYGQLLDLIQRGLKQGQEMGFVKGGDTKLLSVALLGAMKEVFYQALLGWKTPPSKEIVETIYRLAISALARPELLPELERIS